MNYSNSQGLMYILHPGNWLCRSFCASSSLALLLATMVTLACSFRASLATASPMPLLPPVIWGVVMILVINLFYYIQINRYYYRSHLLNMILIHQSIIIKMYNKHSFRASLATARPMPLLPPVIWGIIAFKESFNLRSHLLNMILIH